MFYKSVFFDSERQKVRWTETKTTDLPIKMKYVGKMNRVEFDAFIDFLWEIYGESDITFKDFKKQFDDYRNFLDSKKELFKKR